MSETHDQWWGTPVKTDTYDRTVSGHRYRCIRSSSEWIVMHVTKIGAIAFATTHSLDEARDAALAHRQCSIF